MTDHDAESDADQAAEAITSKLEPLALAITEVAENTTECNRAPAPAPATPRDEDWCGMGLELRGRHLYRLEKRLGHGGMGSVYRARRISSPDTLPAAPPDVVAIKLFHPPEGQDSAGLLKRELSSLIALRHDRIPQVYDWNVHSRLAFAAFEYFERGSLAAELTANGPLHEKCCWRLLGDLMSALKAAHLASIVHLDVRPENVLLDNEGGYVLTDFGISQGSMVSRSAIATGLGAAGYRSPEQRRADHSALDTRTDLWGAGITVWSAYTGLKPFQQTELLQPSTRYHGLPSISILRPGCSEELENVVMSLLTNRAADRPGCAAEVLERIESYLSGKTGSPKLNTANTPCEMEPGEINEVIKSLMDPVWFSVCSKPELRRYFRKFSDGELLCEEADKTYTTFVLLKGVVAVERGGLPLTTEKREGTFIGEVTTLTGRARTASVRAIGTVWTCMFNAAELENLVAHNPAVGIRLVKSLAERIIRERDLSAKPPTESGMQQMRESLI